MSPRSTLSRFLDAAIWVLGADILIVTVTGAFSFFTPSWHVGAAGFGIRVALLALFLVWRFRSVGNRLAGVARRGTAGRWLLLLLMLTTLVHFQAGGGRLNGDGFSYYAFLHSLFKDGDFDLANEYRSFGMVDRVIDDSPSGRKRDLAALTKTGLRRSIYSVGPAVVWSPFFLVGEVFARAEVWLGAEPDTDGYGPYYTNAVSLGCFLYGCLGLLLTHDLLRRYFSDFAATAACLLIWLAGFLYWYMVWQPTYAHSASFALAAYAVWLWDRDRASRGRWGFFYLGVILGLGMCVRWQNGVLLLLPAIDLVLRLAREQTRLAGALPALIGLGALTLVGAGIGAFPQMAAWKALYDMWVLPYPPQGTEFVRLDHPWLLETFFSARHGLMSWTPALWLGYLGFIPLVKMRREFALPLLAPLLLMSYVNLCVGDWWGGASFSNRRFDSVLPLLAAGAAASIEGLRAALRARPQLALACLAGTAVLWNTSLAEQQREGLSPGDAPVAFSRLAGRVTSVFSHGAGFPTTWPASWWFAWQHDLPPGQYDSLVGKYVFYRQTSLRGRIEVGDPAAAYLLGEGWGAPQSHTDGRYRRLEQRARVLAALDAPEAITLLVRFRAEAGETALVTVQVNGHDIGRVVAPPTWSDATLVVSESPWRRELNDIVFDVDRPVHVRYLHLSPLRARPDSLVADHVGPVSGRLSEDGGRGLGERGIAHAELLAPALYGEIISRREGVELFPGERRLVRDDRSQAKGEPVKRERHRNERTAISTERSHLAEKLDEGDALVPDDVVDGARRRSIQNGQDHPAYVPDEQRLAHVATVAGQRQCGQTTHQAAYQSEMLHIEPAVEKWGTQHGVRQTTLAHSLLASTLRTRIEIVGHREHDGGAEIHEMRNSVSATRVDHVLRGDYVVALVRFFGGRSNLRFEIDDRVRAREKAAPSASGGVPGAGEIDDVGRHARGAALQQPQIRGIAVEGHDVVPALDEQGNEVLAYHTRRSGDNQLPRHEPVCYGTAGPARNAVTEARRARRIQSRRE